MVRRLLLTGLALSIGLVALASSAQSAERKAEEARPNLLIILTDDQADGTMAWMPRMERILSEQGVEYQNGFVTTPLCCPSRASIFSGRYMHNHGVSDNESVERLNADKTWQKELSKAGYTTALTGKYLNGLNRARPPHFDYWGSGVKSKASRKLDASRLGLARGFLRRLEQRDRDPWAMQINLHAPHSPFNPPPRYEDLQVGSYRRNPATRESDLSDKAPVMRKASVPRDRIQRFYEGHARTLRIADDLLAQFWRKLGRYGERENTLIVFTSDNGFALGEHRLLSKEKPYAPIVGVPFYLVWEGVIVPGISDELVANVDIAPTLYDAAGVDPDYKVDGQTLLDETERQWLYLESARTPHRRRAWWDAFLDDDEHYIRWSNQGWTEDYDRLDDPWQLEAGNDARPDLERLMDEAATCRGEACP